MKYINLIDKLSSTDKETIKAYITKYGCNEQFFIGIDKWLENWSHSNQILYRFLGGSFIQQFPYEYEKTPAMLTKEISDLLYSSDLKDDYHYFYWKFVKTVDYLTKDDISFFNHLLDISNFVNERIEYSLKIKKPNANKMLQIQAGAKPIKAIGRVIEYFKDDYNFNTEALEEFRKKYSIIISEKVIKGKFCISIHPMDFMTMSDNDSNWSSCMSWRDDGCYHIGTVEMMNSNNVVCAYLLNNDRPYVFDADKTNPETGEMIGAWNNKRWRQLFYITKDIIMGGKPYPYHSKELTLSILNQVKELAKENLKWDYKFGPELYKDMEHISTAYHMDKQREWMKIEKKSPVKHNIIWDTKGMYNDMINDHSTNYWCFRNKTNHTKIINVSGKAPCLCCGEQVTNRWEDEDDYNDRYNNTGYVVCEDCRDNKFRCDCCGSSYPIKGLYTLKNGRKVCSDCLKSMRVCPCCGEIYNPSYEDSTEQFVFNNYVFEKLVKKEEFPQKIRYRLMYPNCYTPQDLDAELKDMSDSNSYDNNIILNLERLFVHEKCEHKITSIFMEHKKDMEFERIWSNSKDLFYIVDPKIAEKYRYHNLKKPDPQDILTEVSKAST